MQSCSTRSSLASAAGKFAGDPTVLHAHDAVGEPEDLGQLGRDQQDPDPLLRQRLDQRVDLGLGADVDAPRRLVEDQHLGLGGEPAGEHDLLLVAARELADRLGSDGVLTRRRRT